MSSWGGKQEKLFCKSRIGNCDSTAWYFQYLKEKDNVCTDWGKKKRYIDYQIDELTQEGERERYREKEGSMDRLDGWMEGKPHLAKKRLFGLPIQQRESPKRLISCSQ